MSVLDQLWELGNNFNWMWCNLCNWGWNCLIIKLDESYWGVDEWVNKVCQFVQFSLLKVFNLIWIWELILEFSLDWDYVV